MGVTEFNESLTQITEGHGGILRCVTCGHTEPVEASYWRTGWPKCCGQTIRWVTARQLAEEKN